MPTRHILPRSMEIGEREAADLDRALTYLGVVTEADATASLPHPSTLERLPGYAISGAIRRTLRDIGEGYVPRGTELAYTAMRLARLLEKADPESFDGRRFFEECGLDPAAWRDDPQARALAGWQPDEPPPPAVWCTPTTPCCGDAWEPCGCGCHA